MAGNKFILYSKQKKRGSWNATETASTIPEAIKRAKILLSNTPERFARIIDAVTGRQIRNGYFEKQESD